MGDWWKAGRDGGADSRIDGDTRVGRIMRPVDVKPVRMPVVYFALAVGGNMVKIGTCADRSALRDRIATLQPGCHWPLKVLLTVDGFGRREEAMVHRLFAAQLVEREWFRCEGALKEMLQVAAVEGEIAASVVLRNKIC